VNRNPALASLIVILLFCVPATKINIQGDSDGFPVHNINTGLSYLTIQDAINANETLDGHAIHVEAGTYTAHVEVNKSVSIVGSGWASTIIRGQTLPPPADYRVFVATANNVTVSGFTVQDGLYGIQTRGNYTSIIDCAIVNNTCGIGSTHSENVSKSYCTTIKRNIIRDNEQYGITSHTSNDTIIHNIVTNNYCGIWLQGFFDLPGMNRSYTTEDSVIVGNEIVNNSLGCYLRDSSNNILYHNNFVNNSMAHAAILDGTNRWDNNLEGNYWSDYNGTDFYSGTAQNETGSDGIGDTPYQIYDNNQDVYPLMRPWVSFEGQAIYIRPNGNVDPSGAPIRRKGDLYTLDMNISSYESGIVIEKNNVILDGKGYTVKGIGGQVDLWYSIPGIDITERSNVTIKDVELEAFYRGFELSNSTRNTISGNRVTGNVYAITLYDSEANDISLNNVTTNTEGIWLEDSSDNRIYGNSIAGNEFNGIYLSNSNETTVSENNIVDNHWRGLSIWESSDCSVSCNNITANNHRGLYLFGPCSIVITDNTFVDDGMMVDLWKPTYGTAVVTDNFVNGKPLIYLEGKSSLAVQNAGQVILINCSDMRIENLSLSDTAIGAELIGTSNSRISWNNITNSFNGLWLKNSNCNIISENNIMANYFGIHLDSSYENIVIGNRVMANDWEGVFLEDSSDNEVNGNDVRGNYDGIALYHNPWAQSSNNRIYENDVSENEIAIHSAFCLSNHIFHNNFVNNTKQCSIAEGSIIWDDGYPSGGNYWSSYIGTDLYCGPYQNETGSDGIGDTPYFTNWTGQDCYPLMGAFSDFNTTWTAHFQSVSNSTMTCFQFDGTAIRFNVSGENGTAGFCRICVPKELMDEPYHIFINDTQVSYNLLPCSNSTHNYLYFNYTHSTQEVVIVPEFPLFLILPLFMIATLLAVIVQKRKHPVQF
jgi:parallel beta-helix repeat protein